MNPKNSIIRNSNLKRFIAYLIVSFIVGVFVYFLFPNLSNSDELKENNKSFVIIFGVILMALLIIHSTSIVESYQKSFFVTVILSSTLIFLLCSVFYAVMLNYWTFKCSLCHEEYRFIMGDKFTVIANNIRTNYLEFGFPKPDLESKNGICDFFYSNFACIPEDLWISDSIKSKENKLYYMLILLISSLIISLIFLIEFNFLGNKITATQPEQPKSDVNPNKEPIAHRNKNLRDINEFNMNIDLAKRLIKENRENEALDIISKLCAEKSDFQKQIDLLQKRLSNFKQQTHDGVLTIEEKSVLGNRISNAIYALIEKVEKVIEDEFTRMSRNE